ncbi:MAG: DUF4251 domain-containing protein [Chitinophagales bacterium]
MIDSSHHFRKLLAIIVIAVFTTTTAQGQNSKKEQEAARIEAVTKMVANRQFHFEVQSVMPSGGRMRQLSPGYSLHLAKDSLTSNLPYFGEAHSPAGVSGGGYNFTSTLFDYTIETRKKGGWEIRIKTKDQQENPDFFLSIFENGSTSLRVNSMSRESISYSGNLAE